MKKTQTILITILALLLSAALLPWKAYAEISEIKLLVDRQPLS